MSCDLLPEWLNLFLDDVETTLCLPILIIMILCTAQFIINHAIEIVYTFYQNLMQKSDDEDGDKVGNDDDFVSKLRGFLCNLTSGMISCSPKLETRSLPPVVRPPSQEEEWDYCEEDDEEN